MDIRALSPVILLGLLGCKDEAAPPELPAATPPPAEKSAPPAAESPGPTGAAEIWLAVGGSQNGCDDVYDYFPGGGMRIFWCHVKTVLPFAALQETAGVKVFESGPHGSDRLVLDAKTSFGRYNPKFVAWLTENAVPPPTAQTRAVYDRIMKERARIYLSALLHLKSNPEYLAEEKRIYLDYLKKPAGVEPHRRHTEIAPLAWPNEYSPAVAFWIRRSIDGTLEAFERGLTKLIRTYDPDGLTAFEEVDFTIPSRDTEKAQGALPYPNETLQGAIKNAWAVFAEREPDVACQHQFAYEPGGSRVQYCRAASILDYRALQEKLDFPIFRKGPHSRTSLDLDSHKSFGHYNPRFVDWIVEHGVPAATHPKLLTLSRPGYHQRLRIPMRLFWYTRRFLREEPAQREKMKAEYRRFMKSPEAAVGHPMYGWESLVPSKVYEVQAIGGTAFAFWLRRSLDGTDDEIERGLRKILQTYDEAFLKTFEATDWKTAKTEAEPYEPPPAFPYGD